MQILVTKYTNILIYYYTNILIYYYYYKIINNTEVAKGFSCANLRAKMIKTH